MRSRRSQPFFVQEVLKGISQERDDQFAAQVAALTCEVSLDAIRHGIHNYIINSRKKPKTKYEYNQERVRDFRVGKSRPGEVVPANIDEVADDLEEQGKASYLLLQTDPVPFVRNYDYGVFTETLNMLNPGHPHFHSIDKLDISNQMVGDERFALLCEGVKKSSIRILNVSGNKLKNKSMQDLADVLRSMHQLAELNISRNKISDEGIKALFDINAYSPTLQKFDGSYNICNATAAYYLGMMFMADRTSALDTLILGGKVGLKGWGDDFAKVLMYYALDFGIKKLKHLSIADAGLSEMSLNCFTALLVCDEAVLETLNISKNEFASSASKIQFSNALLLNRSLMQLTFQQCGFSEAQSNRVKSTVLSHNRFGMMNRAYAKHSVRHKEFLEGQYQLTWQERSAVAQCAAAAWSVCKHAHHKVKISFVKDNPWRVPGPPVWQVVRHAVYGSTDLLTNIATIFQGAQVILPTMVRNLLESMNQDMKYADLLQEALQLCRTMAVDLRALRIKCARKENERIIKDTIHQMEMDLTGSESRLVSYTAMRKSAIETLFHEIDVFRADSEAVLRVAKRRERKNIQVIINEVSMRMNCDRVLQCAEDCRGALIEEAQALEQLIGTFYLQRLLHSCLQQDRAMLQSEPFDFAATLRDTLPYYGNLSTAATFVHYFYLVFGVERQDNQKIKAKVLKNIHRELNGNVPVALSTAGDDVPTTDQESGVAEPKEQEPEVILTGFSAEVAARKKKNKALHQKPTRNRRNNVFLQARQLAAQVNNNVPTDESQQHLMTDDVDEEQQID